MDLRYRFNTIASDSVERICTQISYHVLRELNRFSNIGTRIDTLEWSDVCSADLDICGKIFNVVYEIFSPETESEYVSFDAPVFAQEIESHIRSLGPGTYYVKVYYDTCLQVDFGFNN